MKRSILMLILTAMLLLAGCSKDQADPSPGIKPEKRPADVESTASYDWMAGESPVPVKRIGVLRYGLTRISSANSPNGLYFIKDNYMR